MMKMKMKMKMSSSNKCGCHQTKGWSGTEAYMYRNVKSSDRRGSLRTRIQTKAKEDGSGSSQNGPEEGTGRRQRKDLVLRRKKQDKQEAAVSSQEESQLDNVNPITLGRRARKEVDSAWRKFSRLGQFTSSSLDLEPELTGTKGNEARSELYDFMSFNDYGYEIPQAADTRVLVTGATGTMGRVVLNKLLLRGYTVRALVQNISSDVLESIPPAVELIQGDISDMNAVFEATRDCDKVICCSKARTSLLAEINRVESIGVKNLATSMLHHKNESAAKKQDENGAVANKTSRNKLTLFKFQNFKKSQAAKVRKWGEWEVDGQGDFGNAKLSKAAAPRVSLEMPSEENEAFLFQGRNSDLAEAHSAINVPEGASLEDYEGLVLNLHGQGKKFAVVLYTEEESGRHGYISEIKTLQKNYCTRRVPFTSFTRLSQDQPPLNLANVKEIGIRYRSSWNKMDGASSAVGEGFKQRDTTDARNFRLKLDWIKALPKGEEPDVVLVSCSGGHLTDGDKERYLRPKRAGEANLKNSGLSYTIVRPSKLLNIPSGQKALLFDQGERLNASVSSADVADVCLRCLHSSEARNKTFEVSNEADDAELEEFELVAHIPDRKNDYLATAVSGLERNT